MNYYFQNVDADSLKTERGIEVTFVNNMAKIFMPELAKAKQLIIVGNYTGTGSGKIKVELMEGRI